MLCLTLLRTCCFLPYDVPEGRHPRGFPRVFPVVTPAPKYHTKGACAVAGGTTATRIATLSACYRGPKPQKCPRWLGKGAKGVLDQGAKVSQESFAPPKPCFAPVQLSLSLLHQRKRPWAPLAQKTFCRNFPFPGPLPGPLGRKLEMTKVLQIPVFALPGCQQISVNAFCPHFRGVGKGRGIL